ncbi:MAG: N-6 DNA methylase [Rhodoblastus sp.]|nr:N-6 DNA methylase [Rhodoblastus sp.]
MTLDLFPADPRADAIDLLHAATALYTVRPIVEGLLDRVGWPRAGQSLLDPSAGDGAFLVAALDRLAPKPGDLITALRVQGVELHPGAVIEARSAVAERLAVYGWDADAARAAARRMVIEGDFLTQQDLGRYQIIAGNPPYLRYGHLPEFFKSLYAAITPAFAMADVQHAFLAQCLKHLAHDGQIAFVVADRVLFNEGAAELREHLGQRLGIGHVQRHNAESAFYRPKLRRKGTPPRCHPIEIVLTPAADAPIALTRAPISPDAPGGLPVHTGRTLSDVAVVRLAPWLGPRGIFNIDAAVAAGLPTDKLVPIVENDDVAGDDTLGEPRRFAILTDRSSDPPPEIVRHLQATLNRMPARGRKKAWWTPPEPITLDLSRPGVLVPRIAKRLRAIPIPAGVLPVDHNLHIATSDTVSQDELIAYITSAKAQEFARAHAPRLENGYLDIRTSLIRRLPID